MITKDKQTTKINTLRLINKYEADYTLVLKCCWPKSATKLSDKNKALERTSGELNTCVVQIIQHY